jgi:hypothetical protein
MARALSKRNPGPQGYILGCRKLNGSMEIVVRGEFSKQRCNFSSSHQVSVLPSLKSVANVAIYCHLPSSRCGILVVGQQPNYLNSCPTVDRSHWHL